MLPSEAEQIWLPRHWIVPIDHNGQRMKSDPGVGDVADYEIPPWLWKSHRALCGDEAFEAEKARKRQNETGVDAYYENIDAGY